MNGQMTLFDWMPTACVQFEYPDINDISEAEAVQMVGNAIGLTFVYNDFFEQWQAKKEKMKLRLKYDHFCLDDNQYLFLATYYQYGTRGGGSPCSGIEGAIKYFRGIFDKYSGGKTNG